MKNLVKSSPFPIRQVIHLEGGNLWGIVKQVKNNKTQVLPFSYKKIAKSVAKLDEDISSYEYWEFDITTGKSTGRIDDIICSKDLSRCFLEHGLSCKTKKTFKGMLQEL